MYAIRYLLAAVAACAIFDFILKQSGDAALAFFIVFTLGVLCPVRVRKDQS